MADPPTAPSSRGSDFVARVPNSSSGESLHRVSLALSYIDRAHATQSDLFGSSRKGKGRDDSDEEEGGSSRKIRRGATPRRSDVRAAESTETPTARRDLFRRSRTSGIDPDSTATEAETTRDFNTSAGNNSYSQTMDEDEPEPPAAPSPKPPPFSASRLTSPKSARPSPQNKEIPKHTRAPPRAPAETSDVFGATQTETQASSDDSDREAELERRVRAAGMIGSAAVRAPAGGGLGSRMIRKKF
jgi:hypothetical protein